MFSINQGGLLASSHHLPIYFSVSIKVAYWSTFGYMFMFCVNQGGLWSPFIIYLIMFAIIQGGLLIYLFFSITPVGLHSFLIYFIFSINKGGLLVSISIPSLGCMSWLSCQPTGIKFNSGAHSCVYYLSPSPQGHYIIT